MDSLLETIPETEKLKFCTEIMKRLDIQRKNEHFCDVILEVGSGDDQARLEAHRNVLCAASPFFYNALNSDMKEKKEGVIRLQETSKAVMEEVLEYLYTGHVDINEHNAFDLLAVADYFLIPSLKALCGNVILQALSFSNCIAAYYLAVKYRCEELQEKARGFILANFVAVTEMDDFLNLDIEQVEQWVSSDEIIVKGEEDVFQVIVKWMERNGSKTQHCFADLFCHVRCVYVLRDYIFNTILPHPLVKENVDCSNLVLNTMKLMFNGTEECYFSQTPRNCLKTHEDAIVACGGEETLCYIPSENKWYWLAVMLSERDQFCHAMSACHGKLYYIGGNRIGHTALRYNPSFNRWTPMKAPRQAIKLTTVVTFQGYLYTIGGVNNDDESLSSVQRYNPETNLWQEMPPLSGNRCAVCAVTDGRYLYAVGGMCIPGGRHLDIVERFDSEANSWSRIASTCEKRSTACGASARGKVFIFGGLRIGVPYSKSCEMYDPATNMWSIIPSMAAPRGCASAVSFKEKIFVFGDFGQDDTREMMLQVYDIDKNEWKSCSDFSLGSGKYIISSLRIQRDVLDTCKVVS